MPAPKKEANRKPSRKMNETNPAPADTKPAGLSLAGYNRFLLLVAGLGGLLFGIDVGIIAGALPYLEATFKDAATGQTLNAGQLSFIVAAVLLGSVISTLFAGMLADWLGRKKMMILSGLLFVVSIPVISLAHSYDLLMAGRLLQGISGGFIGVVIPLYLAECLAASNRGRGTGIFQWLLTLGIVAAAGIGLYFSARVDNAAQLGDPDKLFAVKDAAWRSIFWVSLPPGLLFVIGAFLVAESPRWLFRRGRKDAARAALLHSRTEAQAEIELREMAETDAAEKARVSSAGEKVRESLLRRKYVVPFLLACVILACNQATGINSIIGYNTTILIQAGLHDQPAHLCNFLFTVINFLATIGALVLVDRKGRKFLLTLGTSGIIISLILAGLLFRQTEERCVDVKDAVQSQVTTNQTLALTFNYGTATNLLEGKNFGGGSRCTLVVIYSYGDFHGATTAVRSGDLAGKPVEVSRNSVVPAKKFEAVIKHPFANYDAATTAPLTIDHAFITPLSSETNGWLTAVLLFIFVAFFAVGPGVCVWLALSELMPTRIRSNGMGIALFLNTAVSWIIAAVFLPTVGAHGYATVFFAFAGFTVVYFITATFFLPETKGKTLEEIEAHFEGK
jgi:SP family myo-inositol transporter-like MFS transporter 13